MRKTLIFIIKLYRRHVSPAFPPSCRFSPTCSKYALTAVETHGALTGSLLALRRILRCHPFSEGGYDPVPPKLTEERQGRRSPQRGNALMCSHKRTGR